MTNTSDKLVLIIASQGSVSTSALFKKLRGLQDLICIIRWASPWIACAALTSAGGARGLIVVLHKLHIMGGRDSLSLLNRVV